MDTDVHCARLAHDPRAWILLFWPTEEKKCALADVPRPHGPRSGRLPGMGIPVCFTTIP